MPEKGSGTNEMQAVALDRDALPRHVHRCMPCPECRRPRPRWCVNDQARRVIVVQRVQKHYCPYCGGHLSERRLEARDRLCCMACQRPFYENPVPATCTVVVNGSGRILLVRRSVDPKKGDWCLPGGFMELGETPEDAALRELYEETGLRGEIDRLLGVASAPNNDYDTVLMLGFAVCRYTGTPVAGDDADAVRWFDPGCLPQIAFTSHRRFISRCFDPPADGSASTCRDGEAV